MSDIQEEMKRLYMKAIEKDLERSSTNNLVVGRVIKQEEEINKLQEELEYEQYCNEQLRKKITNLKYKIERLENELKGDNK
jgi:predicted  nucleic acid-binding Zn-ribbon protein